MKILETQARQLGLVLTQTQLAQFEIYFQTLQAVNQHTNLTRITTPAEVISKHFLDSLSLWPVLNNWANFQPNLRVIDVGTGPGFPGLPLKILLPGWRLTLLESVGKKTEFLCEVVEKMRLEGVEIHHARAETLAHDPTHREGYDLAVARALANLNTLAEYLLPFVAVGGSVAAQKGTNPQSEVSQATAAIQQLGGQYCHTTPLWVPGLEAERHLIWLDKVSTTPARYPRRPGMPAKRPL